MIFKSIVGATCTCLAVVSFSCNADIISVDWKTAGDNLITRDTDTGLEWLDLTATTARSYSDISSKLGAGQEFDGWLYATRVEIGEFWDAFGGDSAYYNGWSTQNNGLFDAIAPYWGDTYCERRGCAPGEGTSHIITGDMHVESSNQHLVTLSDDVTKDSSVNEDYVMLEFAVAVHPGLASYLYGSALVRETVVPIPSAVWLFGSGLIGLVGLARRKNTRRLAWALGNKGVSNGIF